MRITKKDAGKTVTVEPGIIFVIELPVLRAKGYSWVIASIDDKKLEYMGSNFSAGGSETSGEGGTQYLMFKAVMYGSSVLKLGYVRHGAKKAPEKNFQITIELPR